MAKGFTALKSAKEDINRRKEEGGSGLRYFRLTDGETAVVRFLEQGDDVSCAWVHNIDVPGRKFPLQVPCRDQDEEGRRNLGVDCPGCDKGYPLKFRGKINMIQRDAPIFEKDGERWVQVGSEDSVVVWDVSFESLQELQQKDFKYKGLGSRDFEITRSGSGFDTKYFIEPADVDSGPQPMSKSDKELAAEKFDLTELVTPTSYESWGVSFNKPREVKTPMRESPFSRSRESTDYENAR